jgi:hypothetical protein
MRLTKREKPSANAGTNYEAIEGARGDSAVRKENRQAGASSGGVPSVMAKLAEISEAASLENNARSDVSKAKGGLSTEIWFVSDL